MSPSMRGGHPLTRLAVTLGFVAFGVGCGAESGTIPTTVDVTTPEVAPAVADAAAAVAAETVAPEPIALPKTRRPAVELMSARDESRLLVPAPATAASEPAPAPAPAPTITGTVRLAFAPTPERTPDPAPAPTPVVTGTVRLEFVPAPATEPVPTPSVDASPSPDVSGFVDRINLALIGAPSVTSFGFGGGTSKRTVSQTTLPIVVLLPLTERFSMDLATAFATSEVAVGGAAVSTITGLTDTQLRGNYTVGESMLITAGLNLPTGQYLIPASQQEAAGQIGNDFLNYGVSSMGTGFALTGGVAYARPIGSWNLGLGSSLRKATRFDAFEVDSAPLRFTPSDELRLRVGVDRPVGDGQIDLGLSYSAFGVDVADTTTYSTGDRLIATAGWSFPVKGVRAYLSAWNLFRSAGEQLGGPAPGENVLNLAGGASFEVREILLQPSAELRLWQIDGVRAGNLVNLGVRARLGLGAFAVYPSVGLSTGTLFSTTDGTELDLSGFRGSLTVRWR